MPRYCTHCGSTLREVGDYRSYWITLLECPNQPWTHTFLEVGDARLVFPLLDLGTEVRDKLVSAEPSLVKLAVSRIRTIDYKTVSIVDFEQTLLGCYREADHAP